MQGSCYICLLYSLSSQANWVQHGEYNMEAAHVDYIPVVECPSMDYIDCLWFCFGVLVVSHSFWECLSIYFRVQLFAFLFLTVQQSMLLKAIAKYNLALNQSYHPLYLFAAISYFQNHQSLWYWNHRRLGMPFLVLQWSMTKQMVWQYGKFVIQKGS